MATAGTIAINMIANIGNFVSGMQKSQGALQSFAKTANTLMKANIAASVTSGIMDSITQYHRATRKGEDSLNAALDAFAARIPILQKFSESFANLSNEITGMAEAMERVAAQNGIFATLFRDYEIMLDTLDRQNRLANASPFEEAQVKAAIEYVDQLNKILELQHKIDAAKLQQPDLYLPNTLKLQQEALRQYEESIKRINHSISDDKLIEGLMQGTENLDAFVKKLQQSVMTVEDHYNEFIKNLLDASVAGMISQDLYQRGIEWAKENILKEDKSNTKSFGDASAIEIDRAISVAGLSMGGMRADKQDLTNTLINETNRILNEMKQKQEMN